MPEGLRIAVLAFVTAAIGTGLARRYALARRLLDTPNARSSHQGSTPRGGGLAIVAGFAVAVATGWGGEGSHLALALLPAALVVAATGFWDDHRDLSAASRIVAHFVAIVWALYWLGAPQVSSVLPAWLAWAAAAVALVWFLNLFNFMDGIDGIAASEAAFVGLAGAWLAAGAGQAEVAVALLALAAASLGFLTWNWHPARIFMGDVGSGFLGTALGVLGYAGVQAEAALSWPWVILVGVFVCDATLTLARRFVRGAQWTEAHRSHAYQHAARRWGHARVTLAVIAIDLLWLAPLAWAAWSAPEYGAGLALLAYMPLLALALWWRAGIAEEAGE